MPGLLDGRALGRIASVAKVVVVGSINVDLVVQVARLPAPGETVAGGKFTLAMGGKGANQAVAAAKLGAETWIVGMTADDDFGRAARKDLADSGVNISYIGSGSE